MKAFGRSVIVLNSFEAVTELLENRSSNYSCRPATQMLYKLCVHFPRLRDKTLYRSRCQGWLRGMVHDVYGIRGPVEEISQDHSPVLFAFRDSSV